MVEDKKERQQACLRAFNHYFPAHDRNSGVIKQIKEELERIKQITDLEEKYHEVSIAYGKHRNNEGYVGDHYNNGNLSELGISKLDTIEKYHKLVKELWNLKVETTRKLESKKIEQDKLERESKPESNSSESENTQTTCPECSKTIQPNTDYLNFCSEKCYLKHYGSLCPLCNKYDTTAIYWDKEKYPSLTYCLDCYEKELQRKQENEQETSKESLVDKCMMNETSCEFCGIELPNRRFFPVCDKDECKKSFWKKGEKQESINNISRETKKKEASTINQATYTEQSTLTIINNLFQQVLNLAQSTYGINSPQYQQLKKEQKETISILKKASPIEQEQYLSLIKQLQPFLTKTSHLSESEQQIFISLAQEADEFTERLKEKQVKTQQQLKTNLMLWFCGGLVGLGLIGLMVYLVRRKR